MSHFTEYVEDEFPAIRCDWHECTEYVRTNGYDDVPSGWVSATYQHRRGYIYAGHSTVHKYGDRYGDFCCVEHRDSWLELLASKDKGEPDVIPLGEIMASAI